MEINYVKSDKNKYLLQVKDDPNVDSLWGFYLTDGDNAWDGGLSCGLIRENWEIIEFEDIPRRYSIIRLRLSSAKSVIESGWPCVYLDRYTFDFPDYC